MKTGATSSRSHYFLRAYDISGQHCGVNPKRPKPRHFQRQAPKTPVLRRCFIANLPLPSIQCPARFGWQHDLGGMDWVAARFGWHELGHLVPGSGWGMANGRGFPPLPQRRLSLPGGREMMGRGRAERLFRKSGKSRPKGGTTNGCPYGAGHGRCDPPLRSGTSIPKRKDRMRWRWYPFSCSLSLRGGPLSDARYQWQVPGMEGAAGHGRCRAWKGRALFGGGGWSRGAEAVRLSIELIQFLAKGFAHLLELLDRELFGSGVGAESHRLEDFVDFLFGQPVFEC